MPFSRLADRVLEHAPEAGGKEQGEGALAGGLARSLERRAAIRVAQLFPGFADSEGELWDINILADGRSVVAL